MYQTLLYNLDERGIATISFNRADVNNCLNNDVAIELEDAMFKCSKDPAVRCVVITGEGKFFSAGVDVHRFKNFLEKGGGLPPDGMYIWGRTIHAIRFCEKPVIASINGAAAGAGAAISFACDFRVMEKKSRLVGAYIKMGFCGDAGGYYNLARIVGTARATEFYMLAKPIFGEEAFNIGLCNRLAEDGKLKEVTDELAAQLAASATKAIACQKRMTNRFYYNELFELMELERMYMQETSLTEDHAEAVSAFFEKRNPQFKGK